MNTLFAAGTFPLPATIERFGRRGIMMWSAVGLTACMAIFVGMIGASKKTSGTQWTAVAAIIVYNFIFGYGWIGVCWLYGPEVSPVILISQLLSPLPCIHTNIDPNHRLHHSSFVTLVLQPAHSESGSSPLLPYSPAVLHLRKSAGRSGSGCFCPAPSRYRSSTSCALRRLENLLRRLI